MVHHHANVLVLTNVFMFDIMSLMPVFQQFGQLEYGYMNMFTCAL